MADTNTTHDGADDRTMNACGCGSRKREARAPASK